jgi:hypothetical protein
MNSPSSCITNPYPSFLLIVNIGSYGAFFMALWRHLGVTGFDVVAHKKSTIRLRGARMILKWERSHIPYPQACSNHLGLHFFPPIKSILIKPFIPLKHGALFVTFEFQTFWLKKNAYENKQRLFATTDSSNIFHDPKSKMQRCFKLLFNLVIVLYSCSLDMFQWLNHFCLP